MKLISQEVYLESSEIVQHNMKPFNHCHSLTVMTQKDFLACKLCNQYAYNYWGNYCHNDYMQSNENLLTRKSWDDDTRIVIGIFSIKITLRDTQIVIVGFSPTMTICDNKTNECLEN